MKTLAEVEKEMILAAVAEHGAIKAAKLLGLGKTSIYRKLREYADADHQGRQDDTQGE